VTFLGAPPSFKLSGVEDATSLLNHFREMIKRHEPELSRILMKSKWAEIRSDWGADGRSLENVFYSDLIFMAVDIRSTMCLYYKPTNAEEYRLLPELAFGNKYREELCDTVMAQRILWYAYATSDHQITEEIRSVSQSLEVLKEESLDERFPELIEGLTEVLRGIDGRKVSLTEVMEDPLSRKGGSSLFASMIDRTSRAFNLDALYRNLHHKLDRLDMLGIHVNANVQEYSSLLLQEGNRSVQLTLEFFEAFIIGIYFTELVHMGVETLELKEKLNPGLHVVPVVFHAWWAYYVIALGAVLTALPAITAVRKGRARFAFENPPWLETVERFGAYAGPALLFGVLYSVLTGKGHNLIVWDLKSALLVAAGYLTVIIFGHQVSTGVVTESFGKLSGLVYKKREQPSVYRKSKPGGALNPSAMPAAHTSGQTPGVEPAD
jgi:hypothetical protein